MAKKKLTHKTQAPKEENPQENPRTQDLAASQQPSMEDSREKLQNLKSLNSLLLKETFERRQQVESLLLAKDSLETELTRCFGEKTELETELSYLNDEKVSLGVEKGVFCVFIESQVAEMGFAVDGLVREKAEKGTEIGFLKSEFKGLVMNLEQERKAFGRVCEERDVLRMDFDYLFQEANELRERLIRMEEKERITEEESVNMERTNHLLIEKKDDLERRIEELSRLRNLAETNLVETFKEIEKLKEHYEGIVREKTAIEIERNEQKVKISELEKGMQEVKGIVSSLQKEERVLREQIWELEKSYIEAAGKEMAMAVEIDALKEERREKEKAIFTLMQDKDSRESYIRMHNIDMMGKDEMIEKLSREKNEIEGVKATKEREIAELHGEISRLMDLELVMKESIKRREDKNRELLLEVSHSRDALERVQLERDNALKELDEERKTRVNLKIRLQEMETRTKETDEKFAKMMTDHEDLISRRKELQRQLGLLREEKDSAENNLSDAQKEIENMRSRIESAHINSERALKMLKSTVELVGQSGDVKEEVLVPERKLGYEIDPYAAELEIIENAFRNKETIVVEMKQQVELLQDSVAKARKHNNFWSMVTSATTIVAAAFLAYVAKVR